MNLHGLRCLLPAVTCCLGLAACSTPSSIGARSSAAPSPVQHARLVQQGFGTAAYFAYCQPPHCPAPTRKAYGIADAAGSVGQKPPPFASANQALRTLPERGHEQSASAAAAAEPTRLPVSTFQGGRRPVVQPGDPS